MKRKVFMESLCVLTALTLGGCSKKEKKTLETPYPTEWNLDDLYPSDQSPEFQADQRGGLEDSKAFAAQYKGHLTVENLAKALDAYEKICLKWNRVGAYTYLQYITRMQDANASAVQQKVAELGSKVDALLAFFPVECLKLSYDALQTKMKKDSSLAHYRSWIEDLFRNREHILSEPEESILAKTSPVRGHAWTKFYDEFLTTLDFDLGGTKRKLEFVLHQMSDGKTNQERQAAAEALSKGLQANSFTFKSVYNNVLLNTQITNDLRHYATPEESRLKEDAIDPSIVHAMITAVKQHYPQLSHRYYRIKARLLKQEKLQYWDRSIPVNLGQPDTPISYEEAIRQVLEVYAAFSPTFEKLAKQFVSEGWVDVFPRDGKTSGAFAHPTSANVHPYILLNFMGSQRDLLTIAHEFGHGVHMALSRKMGQLQACPGLALSETASTFAEKQTYAHLIAKVTSPEKKIQLLCGELDDFMNTVVRQTAFFDFELQAHAKREKGEIQASDLDVLWRKTQVEALGDGVTIAACVDNFWMYIHHFFASPFYVYSYVFGRLFVEALSSAYEQDPSAFRETYEKFLSSGGTVTCEEAAKMFGFDLRSPTFWNDLLERIERQISTLEALCKEKGL